MECDAANPTKCHDVATYFFLLKIQYIHWRDGLRTNMHPRAFCEVHYTQTKNGIEKKNYGKEDVDKYSIIITTFDKYLKYKVME